MREKVLPALAVAGFLVCTMVSGDVFEYASPYSRFCREIGLAGPSIACAAEQSGSPYGSSKETYGERRHVATKDEARKLLKDYFSGRDVTIGEIREKQYYFEADITDRSGRLVDKVIVDKRTGRIRSIY
jgi:hypothetical protein